ncbi:MAG: GNAT family N-acetyltransferase [Bdellovibrionota bacterium]
MNGPKFQPIELARHLETAVLFRAETYVISYGHDREFDREKYLEFLRERLSDDPESAVHLFSGGLIVGQLELSRWSKDPSVGYVNFVYLAKEARGSGYGDLLMAYVESYFRTRGLQRARLAVSATNERAIRFYNAHGWSDIGPHPTRPSDRSFEKRLTAPGASPETRHPAS